MAEVRGIVFGAAYESWLKLTRNLDSNDALLHLFHVHDEYCKECTDRHNPTELPTPDAMSGRIASPSESSATATHGSDVSSKEIILTPNRRKLKPKRFLREDTTSLSTETPDETSIDQCSVQIKQEVEDSEFGESDAVETHREPAVDHVDIYMSEEVDDPDCTDVDNSANYRERLIDRIDVYIKEEPEDSEMSNTSSLEVPERSANTMMDQDSSVPLYMESGPGTICLPGYQHQLQGTPGQFAYIDDGISAEKLPKFNWRRKRGFYEQYSPEDKAKIAKYAIDNGIANAVRRFSKELNKQVRESTVREFKKKYLSQSHGKSGEILAKIESKPRGRPKVLVPEEKPKPPPLPPGERRKRGEYQRYSPEIKATVAKYAIDLGCAQAAKYFSKLMNRNINESTIRSFRRSYLEQANGADLQMLESRKRGRPKPKPYSTKVIDHLIEFGTFPSKESCGKFLEDNTVEAAKELEQKTLEEMRKMITNAYQESQEMQGTSSGYPLLTVPERGVHSNRLQSESYECESQQCEVRCDVESGDSETQQGNVDEPVQSDGEGWTEGLKENTDKVCSRTRYDCERNEGSESLKLDDENDISNRDQDSNVKTAVDQTNFQSAAIDIS